VTHSDPLEAIGSRAEWAEDVLANRSVRESLQRVGIRNAAPPGPGRAAAANAFNGCMPHEVGGAALPP